jgi:putative DNA primase/helicase
MSMDRAFEQRVAEANARAHGRWREILIALGVPEQFLQYREGPCPMCGGTTRFRFDDKTGNGDWICSPQGRGCGAGRGFKLLMRFHSWGFGKALREVEATSGGIAPAAPPQRREKKADLSTANKIWAEASAIKRGDEVDQYLANRRVRLSTYPAVLRCHPSLGYYEKVRDADGAEKSQLIARYPAMVARVESLSGELVSIHRTYLTQGAKAPVAEPKKLLLSGIKGAAIRLFEPTEELALAEGIETSLRVHRLTGLPVWATHNCDNMVAVEIPESVKRVSVFADTDAGFAGQACAFRLAQRLANGKLKKQEVAVYLLRVTKEGGYEVRRYSSADTPVDFADLPDLPELVDLRKAA